MNISVSRFLLEVCEVEAEPRDRWGHTPLWDAQMFSRLWMKCFFIVNLHPDKIYFHSFRKDVVSVLKKHLSLVRMACNDIEEEATVPMTQI